MITRQSLSLFKKAAKELPAYQSFLRARECRPEHIKSVDDFKNVPLTSKSTYLQANHREDMIWPKDLQSPLWFCSTSGSTGEPYYFPRNDKLALQASYMAEEFLKNSSHGKGRTLVLMGLGMGVWIGGLITLRAFEIAAERTKAPVAFLAPGYNKTEIFKALKKLSPEFDQTILCCYPPFMKEVLDEAESEGIDLDQLNIRLMFAAEAFTETFRKYVCEKAGITQPLLDTLNIYGTADIGAMAHETPLSILIRELALEDPLLLKDLFGQIEKTPTLAQYRPEFIEFEVVNGQLVITGNAALPLVRYAVGDHGGVMTYEQIEQTLSKYNINLRQAVKNAGIGHTISKRPFVYVYERTDLAVTLHGIIIYPEFVKEGLLDEEIRGYFTEKFTMSTKHDIHHNQFLQINVELRKGVKPTTKLEDLALEKVKQMMITKSSEFAEISKSRASENLLQIVLWDHQHPRYFAPGTKQKWVEKA